MLFPPEEYPGSKISHPTDQSTFFFTCIFGCEQQFGAVVGVRPNAELAGLRVKGELVEPHRADEGDVGGLAVQHVLVRVDPQARQLRQHVDHFVGFQVVDKNVRQPQVLDKLQLCCFPIYIYQQNHNIYNAR